MLTLTVLGSYREVSSILDDRVAESLCLCEQASFPRVLG
jgi:hypothetical protein